MYLGKNSGDPDSTPQNLVSHLRKLMTYSKCSKISNTFLLLVIKVGICKMVVRIANREYPDQTASDAI